MNLGMQLGTSQRLEQTLSPQLRQFVTILQKNSLELDTAIKEELESNPLLELDDSAPMEEREVRDDELPESGAELKTDDLGDNYDDYDSSSLDDSAMTDSGFLDGDDSGDIDYDRYLKDGSMNEDAPFKDLNAPSNDSDEEWDRPIKDYGKSLQDSLRDQLLLWSGTHELLEQLARHDCSEKRFRSLVEYLIDSVNEDGFLKASTPEMAPLHLSDDPFINEIEAVIRGEKVLEDASLPVREAIHVLQGFSPRGIGARDQRECFLIQAYAMPEFPPLGITILEKCYDDLLSLRYAKIGKTLGVSTEDVQQVVASFARLNPHPGFLLSNSRVQLVAADLKIVDKHGRMEIESVRSPLMKRLRINQTYKAILDDKRASKSDREYVKTHLSKAVEFMKALDNRYSTMELVMRAIFKRQKDFFTKGPAFLKPMVQQDIADDIKRDVSTVNRSINGKYVDTPYGIYELKRFFTSGVKQDDSVDGEELSSATILDAIRNLVDNEDKKKPLSDQAISDKLLEQGIKVARRTVAKYREKELRILPANQRKRTF
ncbi:RNA polymerase factor sigma-54 [uncultured Fibrobacter sp.]|uniref:RNA polymerase factor sigma-54 n=1 Tax=uncultured Fibrobacter sp. TaxID=261512 RepID=UPI0026143F0B|nr:RNA polymerase factor sigma-54 [uncultured Fibrobacter sp.]